jgi:uncharacterized protein (TIRG00374 family)
LPGLLISVVAVGLLIRVTDWQELKGALRAMNPSWIGLAIVFYMTGLGFRTLAWRTLLQSKAAFGRVFFTLNEGYLINNLFPFRLGELARAVLLGESTGLSPLFVLSTIVIERAYDLLIAAGLLLSMLPIVLGIPAARSVATFTLILVGAGLLTLYLIARERQLVHGWLNRWAWKQDLLKYRIVPRMDSLIDGLGVLTQPSQFILSVLLMLISWFCGIAEIHAIMLGEALSVPFWWTAFVMGFISLGIALPSAPATLGVYEAASVAAWALLGVPFAQALAVALVAHLIHITITGLIGGYGFFRDRETLSGIYLRIRNIKAS